MDQGLSKSTGKSMYLSIVINVYLFVLIAQKKICIHLPVKTNCISNCTTNLYFSPFAAHGEAQHPPEAHLGGECQVTPDGDIPKLQAS